MRHTLLVVVLLLAAPGAAHASTLRVGTAEARLTVAAGEVNVVRIDGGTLSDSAGLVVSGDLPGACSQPSPTAVTCANWPATLRAVLADGDDSFEISYDQAFYQPAPSGPWSMVDRATT